MATIFASVHALQSGGANIYPFLEATDPLTYETETLGITKSDTAGAVKMAAFQGRLPHFT